MLFRLRKRRESAGGIWHSSELADGATGERQSSRWQAWRRSAQTVPRAWNEWLAAAGCQRAERYRRYISASAEEERAAAELDRAVTLGAEAQDATDCIAPAPHVGDNAPT